MRISDWSSDVCSSDLLARVLKDGGELRFATDDASYLGWALERLTVEPALAWQVAGPADWRHRPDDWPPTRYEEKALAAGRKPDRKSGVEGQRGAVRGDHGGRRNIKKKKNKKETK